MKVPSSKKTLSVFSLVMITVAAVDSLRALPIGAQYGFSIVFYYILAAALFFLPAAMVSAELATGWPQQGGIYIWVREAFGVKIAFFTVWLQWFYNICWYPTIMSLIAATIAYCIEPALIDNKLYMLSVIFSLYWFITWLNFRGIKTSAILINSAAVAGIIIPITFIIILGIIWLGYGKPIHIEFSLKHFFPDLTSINNLVLLTGILFGLLGIENSAAHANDVKNPQHDYPKAMLWATCIILFTLILGSLAIAIIVPIDQLNIISGLLQAFELFFTKFHLSWMMPFLAILIVVGSIGGLNAWMLSPSQGLLIASQDKCLPANFSRVNANGVPSLILIIQGIIFTLLCAVFLLMPTVSSSYWVLSVIAAILSLIVYIPMFLAAIRLRYKFPNVKRSFKIPGGLFGIWLVCLAGLASCIVTIVIGFFPPSQVAVGNIFRYETMVISGVIISCIIPVVIYKINYYFEKK